MYNHAEQAVDLISMVAANPYKFQLHLYLNCNIKGAF